MKALFYRVLPVVLILSWASQNGWAQDPVNSARQSQNASTHASLSTSLSGPKDIENKQPLPAISVLMLEVEAHQKAAEATQKDYLYHASDTVQELDGHGGVKKTRTREYDVFWIEGVPVHKLTKKDGKELNAGEQKKENEQMDKRVARAREKRSKADAKGKETDPYGNEEITVSRFLELGSFSNPRRVKLNGRDTIAVDYAGDPKARTRNRVEDVVRDMAGTVWVDEQDRAISKIEGHFLNTFKIGGGLLVNIQKGTNFSMEQRKVNDEVWLPAQTDGRGTARAFLLFRFNGSFREIDSDYRKFRATSTILPAMSTAAPSTAPR